MYKQYSWRHCTHICTCTCSITAGAHTHQYNVRVVDSLPTTLTWDRHTHACTHARTHTRTHARTHTLTHTVKHTHSETHTQWNTHTASFNPLHKYNVQAASSITSNSYQLHVQCTTVPLDLMVYINPHLCPVCCTSPAICQSKSQSIG